MTKKHINIGDREVHYTVTGKGKRVMLVHGFGEDSQVWKHQIPALSGSCQLILPDLPGTGASDMVGDMGLEALAEALHRILLNEIDAKPGVMDPDDACIMLGHSMGGYITLAFAEKYPSLLAGFGLIHSTADPDNDEKKASRRKSIEFIRTHGSAAFIAQSTPNLFTEDYRKLHPEFVEGMIRDYSGFNPASLIAYYEAMIRRPDRKAVLRSFPKPILFVLGKHDAAVPFEPVMKQTHLPDFSEITILENSGHLGIWQEPERANEAIQGFIGRLKTT